MKLTELQAHDLMEGYLGRLRLHLIAKGVKGQQLKEMLDSEETRLVDWYCTSGPDAESDFLDQLTLSEKGMDNL
jgi:hypothetical protein